MNTWDKWDEVIEWEDEENSSSTTSITRLAHLMETWMLAWQKLMSKRVSSYIIETKRKKRVERPKIKYWQKKGEVKLALVDQKSRLKD